MNYKYKHIFFDLDGTLIDSGPGIIHAVEYALNKYGIIENNYSVLKSFVGPPLNEQFMNCYDFSPEKSLEAIKYFREYYTTQGILENTVYPGISELLQTLAKDNVNILIASSKPEKFIHEILTEHDLLKYFTFIGGSLFDGSRIRKDDVLNHVLTSMNIQNPDECIMIGDRKYDILGAKKFNLASIGVTYGYGTYDELQEVKADYIIEKPLDILNIVR